ncbi:MAG: substrate-binding domain-containing protein [Sphingomonas bacterium]|nr:substrate-binding domain-containing protein [Sphingomonas bacterium]
MKSEPAWLVRLGALALSGAATAQTVPSPAPASTQVPAPAASQVLRVCANPDNLPFSNVKEEGFENRIAELIAAELRVPIAYTWHAQRRAFLRRTLNAGRCDLVMGAPVGLERVVTTNPYYRSTYVFVTRKDRKLGISSFDDAALKGLKIGVHAVGDDGESPPPVYSLARRGMATNIVGYKMWDVATVANPQGRIIAAVANGEIDVAVVWGPFAGYFAKQQRVALKIVPVAPDIPELPFDYAMALGVRTGDDALKARLDTILDKRRDDIRRILTSYGVPLVDKPALASTASNGTRARGGETKKE